MFPLGHSLFVCSQVKARIRIEMSSQQEYLCSFLPSSPETLSLNSHFENNQARIAILSQSVIQGQCPNNSFCFLETAVLRIQGWWLHTLEINSLSIFPLNFFIFSNTERNKFLNDVEVGDCVICHSCSQRCCKI